MSEEGMKRSEGREGKREQGIKRREKCEKRKA